MFSTIKSSVFAAPSAWFVDRDTSWYGTLGVLAASLGVLATCFFSR